MKAKLALLSCIVVFFSQLGMVLADEPLRVATTLSSYADIARSIGGEYVTVSYIAPPSFNPHFIEPKPSDVLKVKRCALFIHSGLDLEAWRGPLIDAAARSDLRSGGAAQLDLSEGIRLLEVPDRQISRAEGDIHLFGNPHYWIDPRNGEVIARAIAARLASMDAVHAGQYDANLQNFLSTLRTGESHWREALKKLHGSEFIGYHNEWVYLMDFAGMTMSRFIEPKPGIPPSAKHLEELQTYARDHRVSGFIRASFYPKEATDFLANKTGLPTLTLCQNVGEIPECPDYVTMVGYNVAQLQKGSSHD